MHAISGKNKTSISVNKDFGAFAAFSFDTTINSGNFVSKLKYVRPKQ